ncbi:substrate-binding periplasmic protein [Thaumasiovibrio subtropicus]|uniref:substrate-binding periplasmic protein n=1 Tax=Thaumasiovibrio subtropicus TaxID=1891207 RepID=UPI000B36360A|nr:transporter substrate-binding domain-containing protein [Thaumasiovibrio subtropicus]
MKAMSRQWCRAGCLFILTAGATLSVSAESLKLTTEDWPPFAIGDNIHTNTLPGFSIEIVNTALARLGYQFSYELQPFKRQITATMHGQYDAMVVLLESDAPDLIFPKQGIGLIRNCFFTHKETVWSYDSPSSLASIRLGVVSGYTYGEIDAHIANASDSIFSVQQEEGDLFGKMVALMDRGRVSAVIEDEAVFGAYLESIDRKEDFLVVGCLEGDIAKIGFSPKMRGATALAEAFDAEMAVMRRSGVLQEILSKYHIEDWDSDE